MDRQIGIGRMVFPVWGMVAATLVIGAAAGQAIGPLVAQLSNQQSPANVAQTSPEPPAPASVAGVMGATVSQAITLDTENLPLNGRVTVSGGVTDWIGLTNDDGTHFTVAYETHVGDTAEIRLNLLNRSAKDVAAKLVMSRPAGFDMDVSGDGTFVRAAQTGSDTWLMTVLSTTAGGNGYVSIRVRAKAGEMPGFFQLGGHIAQIAG